jgi:hypothetical protein
MVRIYIKSYNKQNRKLVQAMMKSINITDYKVTEVDVVNPQSALPDPSDIVLVYGKMCERMLPEEIREHNNKYLFPQPSKLYNTEANKATRQKAKEILRRIRDGEKVESVCKTPEYLAYQTSEGTIRVQEALPSETKLPGVDVVLTTEQAEFINSLKEAFGADSVEIKW